MKMAITLTVLIFTMLFNGVKTFAAENFQGNKVISKIMLTSLNDKELKKCEFSGVHKKDWAQRLQWFESKIINHYKSLNKQNILVVGEQRFLDAFKAATEKNNWQANFTYATSANSSQNERGGEYDLVIDAQYSSQYFKKVYGCLNVSSFRDVYAGILYDETLTFLENNGVKYYFFEPPIVSNVKNLDDFERCLLEKQIPHRKINTLPYRDMLKRLFSNNTECERYLTSGEFTNFKVVNNMGVAMLVDKKGEGLNIINHKRVTTDCPTGYKNKVNVFGTCIVQGFFVTDRYTIPSYVQRLINNKFKNQYLLDNYGVLNSTLTDNFEYILSNSFRLGDKIIVINSCNYILKNVLNRHDVNFYSTTKLFNRPHNFGYWFINSGLHINHVGNEVIANYIYDVIKPELNNDEPAGPAKIVKYQFENEVDTFLDDNPDFKSYLDELRTIKEKNNVNGKVGSIVMNCNPFTLGHKYLIEKAAEQVDHLYIFVVEEDKSVFPFKDRMNLVKEGIADLGEKITVLSSGKWIISLLTFPEYFNKDDLQGTAIDPSNDIKLFGKYICPTLGINKRFVGEEPFDLVTRQYNDTMRRELPQLNIDFQEIPRKSIEGEEVISATKVRKALKANDFETLKRYVPQSTLIYLQENYEKIIKSIDSKYNY